MVYIFLDESGDLGFDYSKKGTSNFFVVTLLVAKNKNAVDKQVSSILKSFTGKQRKRRSGVLHCVHEEDITRKRLLNLLIEQNISLMYICIEKEKIFNHLPEQKQLLYNQISQIIINRLVEYLIRQNEKSAELIASRRETNKFYNLLLC